MSATRRVVACAAFAILLAGLPWTAAPVQAADPIKVGFSMALTGGVAPNGKQNLLALEIWRDDVNAKGGLLGRPVELVYYDDQSNPNNVPGIYTKLISVDKVDLLIGPYATNMGPRDAEHSVAKPFHQRFQLHATGGELTFGLNETCLA